MFRTVAALALCWLATPACAAEALGPVDGIHLQFNKTAKDAGAETRMLLETCPHEATIACRYRVSGDMAVLSEASPSNKKLSDTIMVVFGPKSDAQEFIVAIGIAMKAWSPKADRDERGLALSSLTKSLSTGTDETVSLDGTRYRMGQVKNLGLVTLIVSRR